MTDKELLKQFDLIHKQFKQVNHLIDATHTSTAQRFDQVDKRFDKMDKRFEQVDKRFDKVDEQLEDHTLRLNSIDRKLDAEVGWRDHADKRLSRAEKHLDLPPLESRPY